MAAVDIPAQRAARAILRQPLATGAGQIGALMHRAPNVAGWWSRTPPMAAWRCGGEQRNGSPCHAL